MYRFIKPFHILAVMLYKCGLIHYFWPAGRLIILLMTLVLFPLSSGMVLNFLLTALRLEAKSSSDTNAPFFIEPSLLVQPAYLHLLHGGLFSIRCSAVAPAGSWCRRGHGHASPCSAAVFLWRQETSQIRHVPVAVKSLLSHLQIPLLPAAAINLAEETGVMFESNFISSFINQVSAECLPPGEELCKRHQVFAPLLNWGRWNGERGDSWVCSLGNWTRKKHPILKKNLRIFFCASV